jgi:RHS repeat-associated protein
LFPLSVFIFVGEYGAITEPNGLYYMRARYYDASVGRFISEDPKGFDGGDDNLMAYVGGNPIMRTDPSGEFFNLGAAGAGFVVGFAVGGISAIVNNTDFWKSALVGGLTGASAGLTFGTTLIANAAAGAGVAAAGDLFLQKWRGESVDWSSVGTSALVGGVGGGIGGAMLKGGASAVNSALWSGSIAGGMSSGLSINQNTNYSLRLGCGGR